MRYELNQYYVAEKVGDLTFCENLGCVRHKPGVVRVAMRQRNVCDTRHAFYEVFASDDLARAAGIPLPEDETDSPQGAGEGGSR
jgi:hypothetical protein